jgi:hypothetical protein
MCGRRYNMQEMSDGLLESVKSLFDLSGEIEGEEFEWCV